MDKKQQILDYLEKQLFMPILESPYTSSELKYNFEHTHQMLQGFSAEGILYYIWYSFANPETENVLSNRLIDEGFYEYQNILERFKHQFTYEWLIS